MSPRGAVGGVALIALATVMLEVVLTRLFSVVLWYHMSLVAVSMAMCGLAAGGLIVHQGGHRFPTTTALAACGRYALAFSVSIIGSLVVCLGTPVRFEASVFGMVMFAYWIAIAAVPFLFSGICITIALTRFPQNVNRIYAGDLAGAATACLAAVLVLNLMDAISAIIMIAAVAAMGSFVFAGMSARAVPRLLLALVFGAGAIANAHVHGLRIRYVLGDYVGSVTLRHEIWNAFSYVTALPPRPIAQYWGAGSNAPRPRAESLEVFMDTRASTSMVRFENDFASVEWLMFDVTNLVHHLRGAWCCRRCWGSSRSWRLRSSRSPSPGSISAARWR